MKLKSGLEVKLKDLSVDERDVILDSVRWDYVDGKATAVKVFNATMTKVIRMSVKEADDKFLKSISLEDKSDLFMKIQNSLVMGEGKASDSK